MFVYSLIDGLIRKQCNSLIEMISPGPGDLLVLKGYR
jgi:hypothetical protein